MSIEEDTKMIEETEPTDPLCGEPVKEETNEVIQKPKVKKPRSEAQIKAFAVARQKLAEKRKINKENKEKEMAVKVKEKELAKRKVEEVNQKFEELVVNDEEEAQPPVVITKPKNTRKKKAKQKIVVEEDSSSDGEQEIVIRRVRKGRGKKHPEPTIPKPESPPSPPLQPVDEPIYTEEPLPKKYSNKMLLKVFGM
jgi:hypothetical protein